MAVESSLPAYTTIENILKLIDALRRKNNNEEEARPLFGMGDTAFSTTKSVLRKFKIIEESNTDFTATGRQIAYAGNDEERKKIILEVIKEYPPYEALLHNIAEKREPETDINYIVSFWRKFNYGSTERNRKDAATLFGNIVEYIGFGTFKKGRGKHPTRIIWEPGIESQILNTGQKSEEPEREFNEDSLIQQSVEEKQTDNGIPEHEKDTGYSNQYRYINTKKGPFIIVKVDMTNWPEEKMKNFFKLAYGNLGDD